MDGRHLPKMEKIRELNKTGVTFTWDEPHKKEFREMKERLDKVCKIHAYDKSLPMEMFCYAAKTGGLGYVLTMSIISSMQGPQV